LSRLRTGRCTAAIAPGQFTEGGSSGPSAAAARWSSCGGRRRARHRTMAPRVGQGGALARRGHGGDGAAQCSAERRGEAHLQSAGEWTRRGLRWAAGGGGELEANGEGRRGRLFFGRAVRVNGLPGARVRQAREGVRRAAGRRSMKLVPGRASRADAAGRQRASRQEGGAAHLHGEVARLGARGEGRARPLPHVRFGVGRHRLQVVRRGGALPRGRRDVACPISTGGWGVACPIVFLGGGGSIQPSGRALGHGWFWMPPGPFDALCAGETDGGWSGRATARTAESPSASYSSWRCAGSRSAVPNTSAAARRSAT